MTSSRITEHSTFLKAEQEKRRRRIDQLEQRLAAERLELNKNEQLVEDLDTMNAKAIIP